MAAFAFSNEIKWVPTAEMAIGLITKENTYAKITGVVYAIDLGFVSIKVPFEKRIDLKPYVEQFVKNKIGEFFGDSGKQAVDAWNEMFG